MENKKNNENTNEKINYIADEDALKEIDFGSFLDESSKDAPAFEGFHDDIEKTEKALENELQSLYDDIVNSGPATIVPKPLSVITSENGDGEKSAESGLEELWMSPEEYFEIDIPVVSLDGSDNSDDGDGAVSEDALFKPEPADADKEKKTPSADDVKNDIFGLIDSMKSETESDKGFGDILAEIESNSEITPVSDDFDSIAGFLDTLPAADADNGASDEASAEEDNSSDSTSDEAQSDGDFVVVIPDDGNDYSFADTQDENESDGSKQPQIVFGTDTDETYDRPLIEQTERVIGDFEAAQKAALEASVEETKEEKKARKQREKEEKKNGEKQPVGAGEIIRRIVLALSVLVIIASGVILANTYIIQPNIAKKLINDTVSNLADGVKEHGDAVIDQSIRGQYDVTFPDGMLAKYAPLYATNTDLRGWISIPAFEINLPVVQGSDNDYYLKRNIYKKWTEYGVPFFDYRIAENQFDTLPRNTVIYGHNMRSDDLIFGMLEEYRDIDGFKRAPVIECNTIYGDNLWLVCGVFISNSKAEQDNGYVFPYNFIDCSDQKFAEYIVELEKRSFYDTGVDLAVTDKILTLSTCCYDFEDARLVVVARLLRDGESVSVDTSKAVKNPNPKGPQAWYDSLGKANNYAYDARW
ncbi:MAG: sortase [Clostridia bacterium]|nr:sortase [Clostridia bacterium]